MAMDIVQSLDFPVFTSCELLQFLAELIDVLRAEVELLELGR